MSALNDRTWYISRDNQRVGPFSADEFARIETAGGLRPTDQVWQTGMDAWIDYRAPRKIASGKSSTKSDSMMAAAVARDRGEPCGRQAFST